MRVISGLVAILLALTLTACGDGSRSSRLDLPGATNLPSENEWGSTVALTYRIDSVSEHIAAFEPENPETLRVLSRPAQTYMIVLFLESGANIESFMLRFQSIVFDRAVNLCLVQGLVPSMVVDGESSAEVYPAGEDLILLYYFYCAAGAA